MNDLKNNQERNSTFLERDLAKFILNSRNLNTNFVNNFYGIALTDTDLQSFNDYVSIVNLSAKGNSALMASKQTGISQRKIEHWIYNGNMPFVMRILNHYLYFKNLKKGCKILSLNSTRGGLFTGPWIQVPTKINSYSDVKAVLSQLKESTYFFTKQQLFRSKEVNKEELFAYFLGFLIGDASKTGIQRKQRTTRRVHIRLSKRYWTNERCGEFVSMCVNSIGLSMNKRKDCPAGKLNPYPFYTWISQSSLLIQWVFRVCLGLENNMTTTYDEINAEWILGTPLLFRIRFIQGLADSDGFVDFTARQAGVITTPNTDLLEKILSSLNIRTTRRYFGSSKLWSLMINIHDAKNLPLFNEYVGSYRYQEMKALSKAKRYNKWPTKFRNKVEKNIECGYTGTKLVRKILKEEGVLITTKHINKKKRLLMKNQQEKSITLGVESTALSK